MRVASERSHTRSLANWSIRLSKPNIILLTIDTLRADRLGCYGCERPLTPNLDRLAQQGVRFTQAITGGSWTQAAFPVMMSSTYASMYGGCLGALAGERPSPIQTISDNGYAAAGFSTSPLVSRAYGYHRGFRHFVDLVPDEKDPPLRGRKGGQRLLRAPAIHAIAKFFGRQTRPAKIYATAAELTDTACRWLDGIDAPFFAWLHYMDVHWPYHREELLTEPADIAQAWRDLAHLHNANWYGAAITPQQRDHYIQLYEDALVYADAQIGRLLDYLEQSGKLDDTIIVVAADHGEEFLEHGRWGHWEDNLHDEILKVPLILRLPGQNEPIIVEKQVRLLDLMPTLLDLCGCDAPDGLEGTSLRPLWEQELSFLRRQESKQMDTRLRGYDSLVSISEMWREAWHIIAVRTESFKYIWDSKQPDQPLLFDLQADPGETRNVLADHADIAAALHVHVDARRQQMMATKPEETAVQPDLGPDVMERLRGLGYVE